jgi:perosamine synthetase
MNYLAPAGTPISIGQLSKWLFKAVTTDNSLNKFADKFKHDTGVKHCMFLSSGRTALYLLLRCIYELNGDTNRNQVIIPSYTCFSVPSSVVKAGLQIRVCDINPTTLSYNIDELSNFDFTNVLAIVTGNLYGIPNELPAIEIIASQHGVYLVDDAAQCLGGSINEKASGTFGDAGIYSLDKGKNITTIQGGIIVTNSDDIAFKMSQIINSLPKQSPSDLFAECIKLVIYALLLPPNRYWIVTKLPFIKLGLTPYTTDYPVHKYSETMATMGSLLYDNLNQITEQRIHNALELHRRLINFDDLQFIRYPEHSYPVFLRFPILVKDKNKRDKIVSQLNDQGIGATASYPSVVTDIPDIHNIILEQDRNPRAGQDVADQIITLPTHSYLTEQHLEIIVRGFMKVFG